MAPPFDSLQHGLNATPEIVLNLISDTCVRSFNPTEISMSTNFSATNIELSTEMSNLNQNAKSFNPIEISRKDKTSSTDFRLNPFADLFVRTTHQNSYMSSHLNPKAEIPDSRSESANDMPRLSYSEQHVLFIPNVRYVLNALNPLAP